MGQKEAINTEDLPFDFGDQPVAEPEHTQGQRKWEDTKLGQEEGLCLCTFLCLNNLRDGTARHKNWSRAVAKKKKKKENLSYFQNVILMIFL